MAISSELSVPGPVDHFDNLDVAGPIQSG
jgi:hypothetical protein